ncbi:hypothetical protein BV20DRAFT_937327 [Pilatotrama ljubarskyi]|nr:hypothetical protein BV20DRAFT_937327 [Pilatotrama ljubarskyi]
MYGYQNIGLENCLLKTLTLLVDRRMREWADHTERKSTLQNGFRAGYRIENNVFAFRAAIDQARAHDLTLWVALIDLTNALPSVDHDVPWAKVRAWVPEAPSSTGCGCCMPACTTS